MASKATLTKNALKSAKEIMSSRSAFAPTYLDRLVRSCAKLGILLVISGNSVMAQDMASVAEKPAPDKAVTAQRTMRPSEAAGKRVLVGHTGKTYKLRSGQEVPVWVSPNGKFFIVRPSGKRAYPKSLNK